MITNNWTLTHFEKTFPTHRLLSLKRLVSMQVYRTYPLGPKKNYKESVQLIKCNINFHHNKTKRQLKTFSFLFRFHWFKILDYVSSIQMSCLGIEHLQLKRERKPQISPVLTTPVSLHHKHSNTGSTFANQQCHEYAKRRTLARWNPFGALGGCMAQPSYPTPRVFHP